MLVIVVMMVVILFYKPILHLTVGLHACIVFHYNGRLAIHTYRLMDWTSMQEVRVKLGQVKARLSKSWPNGPKGGRYTMGRMCLFFDLACACQVVHTTFGPKKPLYLKSTHNQGVTLLLDIIKELHIQI